ncbi:MAG: hypothetical protein N7Q72_04970, partial [Spiroplasma sp. Tabriz.8]|nr:hypothetical protein [Spiroplasma sp. Tabriz.8]
LVLSYLQTIMLCETYKSKINDTIFIYKLIVFYFIIKIIIMIIIIIIIILFLKLMHKTWSFLVILFRKSFTLF